MYSIIQCFCNQLQACAHRFVIAGDDYQWGQGICYSLKEDLEFGRAWQPCKNRPVNKAHEQYGYCQAGTSGEIDEVRFQKFVHSIYFVNVIF